MKSVQDYERFSLITVFLFTSICQRLWSNENLLFKNHMVVFSRTILISENRVKNYLNFMVNKISKLNIKNIFCKLYRQAFLRHMRSTVNFDHFCIKSCYSFFVCRLVWARKLASKFKV